jgi:hypothetical protein
MSKQKSTYRLLAVSSLLLMLGIFSASAALKAPLWLKSMESSATVAGDQEHDPIQNLPAGNAS